MELAGITRVPLFTREEISRGMDVAIGILHEQGITSVTDPGIGLGTLGLYADKARAGTLPIRLTALLSAGPSPDSLRDVLADHRPLRGVEPGRLRVAGIKIFADGIPTAAKTAWLHEPYLDGSNGSLTVDGADHAEQLANLGRMIELAHGAGFQIGTHATGDATIDAVVAGYLRAMRGHRRHDPRHYVQVSSASDAPVTFPSWLQGVMAAVLREGRFGGVAGAAERITLSEALHTYTSTPAWQDRAERWKGTLRPGQAADVCVLAEDILDVDHAQR